MRRLARTLARLPIRVRLTLAFTGVIALVLLVTGFFLARQFEGDLDRSIDDAQRAQAEDIAALVQAGAGTMRSWTAGNATRRSTAPAASGSRRPAPPAGPGCSSLPSC